MPDRSDLEARTRYDPSEVEPRIARAWLDSGIFHPEPGGDPADNYSIAIPLPNVTGVLHMGHALNSSIQDCLSPCSQDEWPAHAGARSGSSGPTTRASRPRPRWRGP